jgi:FKBP-type peptidyl-prolyl cis-trans isomerase
VKVHYTGTLAADGQEFDSSVRRNEPLTADLAGAIIKGWKEAIPGMKVGGRRVIVVPPELGYGRNVIRGPNGEITIPANSTLIFDIELLEVLKP